MTLGQMTGIMMLAPGTPPGHVGGHFVNDGAPL